MLQLTDFPSLLTIEWLRTKYLEKKITPDQVIGIIIQRAQKDKQKNIWITEPNLKFIQTYIDHLSNLPIHKYPLWGIPFAIKDNIDLAEITTTAGCPNYAYTPSEHATVVNKLIQAGAIPIGKTNLDQFATGLVGTRSPYGETHNALRDELISGGSSAGSAVAVARGQAAFSLGTDTAGSGRVPAALNRLVGFKSSCGAWSTKGVVPACASLDCVTVFANSIDDALIVDRAARGFDKECAWSKPYPTPDPQLPKKICLPKYGLRFFGPFKKEYEKAWKKTVTDLHESGLEIEWIDYALFKDIARLLYDGPFVAERWADLGPFVKANPGCTFPVTEEVLMSGAKEEYTASLLFETIHKLNEAKLKVKEILNDAVLITPTAGGTWTREQVRNNPIQTNSDMGEYTNHCNLLNLCAISVPFSDADDQLPFGATFFALPEHEDYILGLARTFGHEAVHLKQSDVPSNTKGETTQFAVCGLHMRGFTLEHQMHEYHAKFVRKVTTAKKYHMFKLETNPPKPGLIKTEHDGSSLQVEIWNFPLGFFGKFTASIPAPLGIGKIELEDGSEVPGFICEHFATVNAKNISSYGSWKNYTENK
ncbi:allophanate hydrolase [Sporolactobacillus terrae]|uniref:Allophanate hydrolase n=1 Tax=Sporolactobacillus terrae TaxID=269673 RepID=A0A5K7WZI3_9BACL|nr:allophanate hydrolase [Sporolactobacillus terrae]BBN97870.1 allophanate hydrolase [Sporolactobacillus terrae]